MSLRLKVHNERTYVIDEETEFCVGSLVPRYELVSDAGNLVGLIDIDSPEKAIPLLKKHYKANPPRWEWDGRGHQKATWYGVLTVEQLSSGKWLAFRDSCALMRDGQRATFHSYVDARAAADNHLHDGFPSASSNNDGLEWADYSLWPTVVNDAQVGNTMITLTGTVEGELDPIVSPIPLAEWEQSRIRGRGQLALLQKAIGVTTVRVLLALAKATTRTKADLEKAVEIISVEVPRMLKLFRRAREYRMSFQAAAREQGGLLLREILPGPDVNDRQLARAIDIPLQFLEDWVRWDKEPAFRERCAGVLARQIVSIRRARDEPPPAS